MRIIPIFFGAIFLFNPFSYAVSNCATLDECRKELSDAPITTRHELISRLAVFKKEAVPYLIAALEDKEWSIQTQAIQALGEIGPEAEDSAPSLVKILGTDIGQHSYIHLDLQARASDSLIKIGPSILPLLVSSLNTENHILQDNLITTLAKIGKVAVPELTPLLKSTEHSLKNGSLKTLTLIGPDAKIAAPGIIKLLKDSDIPTRSNAARALGAIGPVTYDVIPALMVALKENPPTTKKIISYKHGIEQYAPCARESIISAIGAMGPAAAKAIPDLWEEFKRKDNAAIALGKIDPTTIKKTVPILIKKLETPYTEQSENISMILGEMGKEAVPLLINALIDGNPESQEYIIYALGLIGPEAVEASPVLFKIFKETHASFDSEEERRGVSLLTVTCNALWHIDGETAKSIEGPPFNCFYPSAD